MSQPDPIASALPIDRIGRFEVVDRLGAGGMAEVLLAVRRTEGFVRAVALKRALPALAAQARFRAMMRREAQLAALVHHPNCVEVHDLEEEGLECAVVMELLHGLDAAQLLRCVRERGERLSPHAVTRIVLDAAKGLHHVHGLRDAEGASLGIVHRDISPHNLFVTDAGLTKILDFGIAKAALETDEITRTGVLKGKFRYMAPEQLASGHVDARTDVFALAVSAWELLTGAALFDGGALQAVERMKARTPLALMRRPEASDLPSELLTVLERALAHEPAHRMADMQAFHDELLAACAPASHEDVARWVEHTAGEQVRAQRDRVRRVSRLRVSGSAGQRSGESSGEDTPVPAHRRAVQDTLRLDDEPTRDLLSPPRPQAAAPASLREEATAPGRARRSVPLERTPAEAVSPSEPLPELAIAPTQLAPRPTPAKREHADHLPPVDPEAESITIDRARSVTLPERKRAMGRDTLAEHSPDRDRVRSALSAASPSRIDRSSRPAARAPHEALWWDLVVFALAIVAGAGAAYWLS